MTCIKKGLSELALNRPSIKKVKSALPMPLFAFWAIFEFLRKDLGRFYLCKDCYTVPSYRLVFPRKDEGKEIV